MRKYLKSLALVLVVGLITIWFGRRLDWAKIADELRQSDLKLIAVAVALVCLTYLVRAFRWRALLDPLVRNVSLRELFAATTVGFGAVFLIGRVGEVLRPAFLPLRDGRVRPGAAFVTIAVERLYDMMAIVVLFAANLLLFLDPVGDAATFIRMRKAGLVMLLGCAAGVVALILLRRHAPSLIRWLGGASNSRSSLLMRVSGIVTVLLEQLAQALRVLVSARELMTTIGWTVLLWALIALANMLVFRAFGLRLGLSETLFVMGWSLVGSLVPTPGGAAGTFHVATAAGLVFLGAARSEEEAAAASIILHLVVFGPAAFFGLYYILRSDITLARLRYLASGKVSERETNGDEGQTNIKSQQLLAGEGI